VRIVRNRLETDSAGRIRPVPTETLEVLPAQLVFRSVGYRGVAIPGLPFDDSKGVIPNVGGRVIVDEQPTPGVYATGWIKRGPSGVIGTNKPDAVETVESLLADLRDDRLEYPESVSADAIVELVRSRQPDVVSYDDWLCIDAHEVAMGGPAGRPRVKLTRVEAMLEVFRQHAQLSDPSTLRT
jgi:ferredoxin/flavodoxin---NADP+ reductase